MTFHDIFWLRPDYWIESFFGGVASGLIEDGIYEPNADRDLVAMYCGASFYGKNIN